MVTNSGYKGNRLIECLDFVEQLEKLEFLLELYLDFTGENLFIPGQTNKNQLLTFNKSIQLVELYQARHSELVNEIKTVLKVLISTNSSK